MDNFTPIRNGIREHISAGNLCPFDLGIYVFLHLGADWATGIFHGCALSLAYAFNDPSLKHHINKSLIRLRGRQYINYPKGCGRRGAYEMLIHKYEVTVGELRGKRLNAWRHGELCRPAYDDRNSGGTAGERSENGGGRVEEPILDLQDVKDVKTKKTPFAPDGACERIYDTYPRHVGKVAALKAIAKAIAVIKEAKEATAEYAVDFLYSQVLKFTNSPAGQRGRYTPHCATWMNDGRYFDDPIEWHRATPTNGNGKPSITEVIEREQSIIRMRAN
jgi:hypothetical protein